MRRVLALDLSKHSAGWAVDGEPDGPPRAGSWRGMSASLPGRAGFLFSQWLNEGIKTWKPDIIAVEAPAFGATGGGKGGFVMNRETAKMLIGLAFLAETLAAGYRLQFREVAVSTVRKTLLGHGRPDNPKKAVMDRCKALGWEVDSHDAADAAALWLHVKLTEDRGFQPATGTPLFAERAGA